MEQTVSPGRETIVCAWTGWGKGPLGGSRPPCTLVDLLYMYPVQTLCVALRIQKWLSTATVLESPQYRVGKAQKWII